MMKSVIGALLATSAFAGLESTLKPVREHVDFGEEALLLDYEIRNTGDEVESFLPWHTPVDEIWEDIFDVRDAQGNMVPYTGRIARRAPTEDSDFVHLAPGEFLTATVDIGRSYMLEQDGVYGISLKNYRNSSDASFATTSNTVALDITSAHLQLDRFEQTMGGDYVVEPGRHLLQSAIINCDSSQTNAVRNGYSVAINTQIPNARSCLGRGTGCSQYTTWFGTYSSSRASTVSNCWNNIRSQIGGSRAQCCVGCGSNCGRNLYGYVYPSDTNQNIYLCSLYFSLTNEQAETLTHEQSHFTRTCGTQDFTYGESNCQNLARTNPGNAIRNADNHCFFGRYARP
jgi:peptidyl-Lys metalloendopeptidase